MGLFYRPRRFHFVRLEGLRITIPPRASPDRDSEKQARANVSGPVIIEQLESKDAELVIVPRQSRTSRRGYLRFTISTCGRWGSIARCPSPPR